MSEFDMKAGPFVSYEIITKNYDLPCDLEL